MKNSGKFKAIAVVIVLSIFLSFLNSPFQSVHANDNRGFFEGPNGPGSNPLLQQDIEQEVVTESDQGLIKEDFSASPVTIMPTYSTEPYRAELKPGESQTFNLVYTVPEVIFDRGDIMFVFDRTGSMGGSLSTAQANAIQMMNDIRAQLPYAWFGVASFMDYPGYFVYPGYSAQYGESSSGDQPWILGIDPTETIADVSNVINALTLGYGADGPEDYTRALYELQFINWRAGSKKVVVLFGDAPTHDLDFAGYNFGGDPGRNAIANDSDDLDFETVVRQLKTEGISVIAIDSGYSTESAATLKGMSIGYAGASGTGGLYYQLSDTSDLPAKVVELIEFETGTIDRLEVKIPEEYTSWVNVTPAYFENLLPANSVEFEIEVTVPDGTEPGFYPFIGMLQADGSNLALLYFEITVPGNSGSLDLGFNPKNDGYSFDNFSDSSKYYIPLSWDMFETFFGTENVEHMNGDPIGMAQYFYEHSYKYAGDGGNCTGFSVTSMFNFLDINPTNMGKYALPHFDKLWDAKLDDPKVRDAIEFGQGMWFSSEIALSEGSMCEILGGSPVAFFNYLKSLFQNEQPAVVSIYSKDGGHSLLPYRLVEDPVKKKNFIYVYDSNDPQQWWDWDENRIEIDTSKDEWSYSNLPWSGDSDPCNFRVVPLEMYKYKGVPFWNTVWSSSSTEANTSTISIDNIYFIVEGPTKLLFIDDLGNRFGWQDGTFYNEIRGATFIPEMNVSEEANGMYSIPEDLQYQLALIGSGEGLGSLDYWHGDLFFGLREINLLDGSMAGIVISEVDRTIEIISLVGEFKFDLINNSLAADKDISLHLSDIVVEEGSFAKIVFEPVSELATSLGDTWKLSTNNVNSHLLGVGLIHRGGEGFASFSNFEVEVYPNSMGRLAVSDWQNMTEINFDSDLDGDDVVDTAQMLQNTSQVSSLELQADRIQVNCGETVQLVALVKDGLGIPINNGTEVEFSTTLGELSSKTGITSGGRVEIELGYSSSWGIATVIASIPGSEVSTSIMIEFVPFSTYLPVMLTN